MNKQWLQRAFYNHIYPIYDALLFRFLSYLAAMEVFSLAFFPHIHIRDKIYCFNCIFYCASMTVRDSLLLFEKCPFEWHR